MKIVFRCNPEMEPALLRPFAAKRGIPDWFKAMPMTAFSPLHDDDEPTVKQCPPFVDAMTQGFMIPLPCDVTVRNGEFSWDWPLPASIADQKRSPLSFHSSAQVTDTPLFDPDVVLLKFNNYWTIQLEPGYSLLFTHPLNRLDLPFRTLSGLVDSDLFSDVPIFFPAVWSSPEFEGVLPKGTPVAHCIPVLRQGYEFAFEPLTGERARISDQVTEEVLSRRGVYREKYRAPRS